METKQHIHKDCLIIEYPDGTFLATALDVNGDPIEKTCKSLKAAKRWIDRAEQINIEAFNNLDKKKHTN